MQFPEQSPQSDWVTINVDRGFLRLQFARSLSRHYWQKEQKYWALGLKDNPVNRQIARQIALEIQQDVRANKLDVSLNSYSITSRLIKKVGIFYDPTRIQMELLELYDAYCEQIKSRLCITTFEHRYRGYYRRGLAECPQDLSNPMAIRNRLLELRSQYHTCHILNVLYEMIEWARDAGLIHPQAPNRFKDVKKGINPRPPKPKTPDLVAAIPGHFEDSDIKGFSREESELIMQGFEDLAQSKPHLAYLFDYVRFLFWTGCRIGEASGLTWNKVAPDCSYILFEQSFDYRVTQCLKELKTAKDGTLSRKFPCGTKLQSLLLSLRPTMSDPNGFVFTNSIGNPVRVNTLHRQWMGANRRSRIGIVTRLVMEGQIRQYLKPYAMRSTWINLQIEAGVPIKNIAKLAGNSPAVLLKHYESIHPDVSLALEV